MKKFIAAFLTIIMVTSVFLSTTAMAADSLVPEEKPAKTTAVPESTFKFSAFNIKSNDIVVDTEKRLIFGFDNKVTEKKLSDYIEKGENFKEMKFSTDHIGTGSVVTLSNGTTESEESFTTVIFGDVNSDGTYDVLDASVMHNVINGKDQLPTGSPEAYAADLNMDGNLNKDDYSEQVNGVLKQNIEQSGNVTSKGTIDSEVITDKPYTGDKITADDEIKLTFNDGKLSAGKDFEVVGYKYNTEIGEAQVTVKGKGLYSGEKVLTFKIVDLLQDILAKANSLLTESKLSELVTVEDVKNNGVTDININVNATKFLNGNVEVNTAAFNNFLARLDAYKQEKLMDADIKVGNYQITTKGQLNNTALKNLIFDFANGFFYIVANSKDNVIKQYTGNVVTGPKAESPFNVKFNITGNAEDITTLKNVSEKLARHFSFKVVNNNAVINVKMPNAFSQKVVDLIGSGDVEQARAFFDGLTFETALGDYVSKVRPEHFSKAYANEIDKVLGAVISFEGVLNKVLNHVTSAEITNANGVKNQILNGSDLSFDKTNPNKFGSVVIGLAKLLTLDVIDSKVGDYCKNGIYTGVFDVALDVAGIKETVILNVDVFGDVKTPDIIKDTADYLGTIITDLGVQNAVGVKYDKANGRVIGSINATEILNGNFNMDDKALDGLLTEVKGYFDQKFGTSDITIGGFKVVTNGKINNTELKNLLFKFANGFIYDVGNMGVENIIRSFETVVTEANGKTHAFDLDFVLDGNANDTQRISNLAKKIAKYVELDTTTGDASLKVTMPKSVTNKIIELTGEGNPAKSRKFIDSLDVYTLLSDWVAKIRPEHISQSYAKDIQSAINMLQKMDGFFNKVLGKVSSKSTATDANGNTLPLLSGVPFEITENTIGGIAIGFAKIINVDLLDKLVVDYKNPDGTYTLKTNLILTVGGIQEKVNVTFDIFGEADAPTVIEKTANYFDSIVNDLGVQNVVGVTYDPAELKARGSVNASEILAGNLNMNEAALNGLLTNVKDYFTKNFGTSDIEIGGHKVVINGDVQNTALKNFIFDFAHGFFFDAGNIGVDNVLRKYAVKVTEATGKIHSFDMDFALDGSEADIKKVSDLSAKISKYVSLDTSTPDAKVTVKMPKSVTNKIVELVGEGNPAKARQFIDSLDVYTLISDWVAKIRPEHISQSSAKDIQSVINMIQKMDGLFNKVLGKVSSKSTATDANGNTLPLLSGVPFEVTENTIGGIALGFAKIINVDLLDKLVVDYKNPDGTYTLNTNIILTVGGIQEKVSLTFDIFDGADAPTEIDETAKYFDSILTDLGINNAVAVKYDAAAERAVGTVNATDILNNNIQFNDAALDGLLTKTKDFFNKTYGNSDITVGGHKLVTKGVIDKTALKNLLFEFAHGFLFDVGNMGVESVIRSFPTTVVNDKNETRSFKLDFELAGDKADVEKVSRLCGKVSKYVELDTTTPNAKVNVVMPKGVTNKVVELLSNGKGDAKAAQEAFDALTVYDVFESYFSKIQPEHISQSSAQDIQTIVNLVQNADGFVEKVRSKITTDSKAYDANGNGYTLLSGEKFVVNKATIGEIGWAAARILNVDLLDKPVSDFKNPDGTYSLKVDVGLTVGGIRETVTLNMDIFGTTVNKAVTSTSDGSAVTTASLKTYSAPATAEIQAAVKNGEMSVEIEANSRIKAKVNAQGGVPSVKGNLIVGVPFTALAEDKLFSVDDADSTIIYKNSDNVEFTKGSISTGTKVIVKNNKTEATFEFSIVSYGDANGDANLDVLDMHIASLYSLGKDVPYGNEASKEASKITENETLDAHNYGEIVNSVIRGEQTDKGIKKLISLCETEAVVPPTYTGTELTPNVSVLDNGVKVDSKNYKVTYENNINAGELTATAIIEGINGYTGIKRVPFTINKATIDDSILFDSYICPSNNIVGAKFTASDLFKKYVTVKYNGSTTLPTTPGVYKVTADIKEDSNYTFLGGQRDLGFMLVSPKSSTGYKIITDSANKNIYVDVTNALQDFTAFNNVIGTWFNTNYNLTVDGKNTADAASVAKSLKQLPTMKRYYNGTNVDKKSAKLIEDRANVLGCYLPDIYTLWNNQNAESSTAVSISDGKGSDLSFNVVFRQDAVTIGLKKGSDFVYMCGYGRGGRTVDPLTYAGVPGNIIASRTTKKAFVFSRLQENAETNALEKTITVNFGKGRSYPSMTDAFQGTGLKTTVLGPNNAVVFKSTATKAELNKVVIDANAVKLYDESANNRRFVSYGGSEIVLNAPKFMGLVNNVLGGMNMNVNLTTPTKNLVGKTGWCKYACQDGSTGLCYTLDYFLTFSNVNEADRHYNVKVNEVAGVKITTYPTQVPDSKTGWIASTAVSKGEGFTVSLDSASIKNGYKIKVTNATTGEEILRNNDYNCYIMPNSNVNVTAVK